MVPFTQRFRSRTVVSFLLMMMFVLLTGMPLFAQDGPAAEAKVDESIILFIIKSSGFFFGPLMLVISIALTALCVLLVLDLRLSSAIPPGFVDEFADIVNKRKFKEAFDMARNDPSFLGRVLTAGMSRLQYGLEDAREAAGNMLESIRSDKDQKNNYTAVIGTVGPLIGLVGTVFGMIEAFQELGKPGATPNPQALASGISHALCITLLGVGVSLPAIFFNAFFKNRIIRITMDTGHVADDLLTQMYHNSKKSGDAAGAKSNPGAAPSAPPAPPKQG